MSLAREKRWWVPVLLPVLLGACASAPRPTPGDPASGLVDDHGLAVSEAGFLRLAADAGYVLLGEQHDSACDHLAQARLLSLLAAAGPPIAVGLEMVASEQQPVLDRFNRGDLSVEELAGALDWKRNWGFAFSLYEPVFAAARRAEAPVVGLNVSSRLVKAVRDETVETLPPAERAMLPAEILPPPDAQLRFLHEVFGAHAAHGSGSAVAPPQGFERFVRVQSLWDTAMATRAAAYRSESGRRMVVLAGAGHVENGWGIASRLSRLDPGAKVLAVMPLAAGRGDGAADVYVACP